MKHASDDNIIVNVSWELGDLIVDCPIGSADSDAENEQKPRVQVHGGRSWHKRHAIPVSFYTSWVSIGAETPRVGMDYQHPASWIASSRGSEDFPKNVRI